MISLPKFNYYSFLKNKGWLGHTWHVFRFRYPTGEIGICPNDSSISFLSCGKRIRLNLSYKVALGPKIIDGRMNFLVSTKQQAALTGSSVYVLYLRKVNLPP